MGALWLLVCRGYLGIEGSNINPLRLCNLTRDEQVTLMSLWTIFRSPLMYGGDLQHPDAFSLALITNAEALNITDHSTNNAYLVSNSSTAVWRADSAAHSSDGRSYFTVHNLSDEPQSIAVELQQLRGQQKGAVCTLRDVWQRQDIGTLTNSRTFTLRPHASGLYALHSCANSTSTTTTTARSTLPRAPRRASRLA